MGSNAEYRVVQLLKQVDALEAQLKALEWTPITEDNMPKVGDEIIRCSRGSRDNMKNGGPYVILNVTALFEWDNTTAEEFHEGGWTHRRPINAPASAPITGEKAGE